MAPSTPANGPQSPSSTSSPFSSDPNPPTTAAFAPSQTASAQRRTVLVQQHSALLIATPPQVTRALAFSHPFLLPLSKLFGLISWSSGDPWESFLLVCSFWALVLFGADVIKWSGPILLAAALVAGMWGRRFSPLSTHAVLSDKEQGKGGPAEKQSVDLDAEGSGIRQQKSLDEIVETLNEFTARCNILLDPLLELTNFLSTQQTATSATTRPALTTLFIRLVMTLPLWVALTLPPLRLITAQRVVLAAGTMFLTWHARPARIARLILWRSLTVRRIVALLTGLDFSSHSLHEASGLSRRQSQIATASSLASSRHRSSKQGNVRFTFTVYENQRRWLGLGWTSIMFAYERAAWTDEHLNPASPKERFPLPSVEGATAAWRWVADSEWRTEGGQPGKGGTKSKTGGWVYYDNKWQDPRRSDGWGRYTRRRKWFRDAELVEVPQEAADGERSGTEKGTSIRNGAHSRRSTNASTRSAASVTSSIGVSELPASEPIDVPKSAKGNSSTNSDGQSSFLSPAAASYPSGTGAIDFALADKGDDAASVLSATSAQSGAESSTRRRGFFRRSRSKDSRHHAGSGKDSSESKSRKESMEEEDAARSVNRGGHGEEDEGGWLIGDEVKMGLS